MSRGVWSVYVRAFRSDVPFLDPGCRTGEGSRYLETSLFKGFLFRGNSRSGENEILVAENWSEVDVDFRPGFSVNVPEMAGAWASTTDESLGTGRNRTSTVKGVVIK